MIFLIKLRCGTVNLPLHGGHAPSYLIKRMISLSSSISKIIIEEKGTNEFFKKISDPLWFQAFGCTLGFDWHSSGLTTVVTGVLKQALSNEFHGVSIAGGKGKRSTATKIEIPRLAEKHYNLSNQKISRLLYASKMSAKVDNSAIQDGYTLYHHVVFFDKNGNWTIIQQGLNKNNRMARRYHWISDDLKSYIIEPHKGIISSERLSNVLNMTSKDSEHNRKTSVDLSKSGSGLIHSSIKKIPLKLNQVKLDSWIEKKIDHLNSSNSISSFDTAIYEEYEMPRRLNWKIFDKIYEIQPSNYEELLNIQGIGPAAIRALALISEIIYGDKASWKDPVKFSYAHGGKDGVPYPISRKTYDESIKYLSDVIKGSENKNYEKENALSRLSNYSNHIFRSNEYNFNAKK